jgi:hypothetical protein
VFVVMAKSRCDRIILEHEAVLAEADRRLGAEDQKHEQDTKAAERHAEAAPQQPQPETGDEPSEHEAG